MFFGFEGVLMELNVDKFDMPFKIIGLVVLVLVFLMILTWLGLVKCGSIPYWCDVYELVLGSPRVGIVYGDSGLGDPEKLREQLLLPSGVNAKAVDLIHVDRISLGNLKNYKLIIVEKARMLSAEQLAMFMDYVNQGGRLVWVADSGVERAAGEITDFSDINELKKYTNNPWFRVTEAETDAYKVVAFDEFLGLRYFGNYCSLKTCNDANFMVGILVTENTGNHPLIFGLNPSLEMRISKEKDFAVVKQFANSSNSSIVWTLDFQSNIKTDAGDLGKIVPMIATSNTGERVAYYAYPPEYFATEMGYYSVIKRMYLGMLGK